MHDASCGNVWILAGLQISGIIYNLCMHFGLRMSLPFSPSILSIAVSSDVGKRSFTLILMWVLDMKLFCHQIAFCVSWEVSPHLQMAHCNFAACRFLCISDGLSPLSPREWAHSSALHMPIGVSAVSLSSLGMGLWLAVSFPLNSEATQISSSFKIHYGINYVHHYNDLCFPLY